MHEFIKVWTAWNDAAGDCVRTNFQSSIKERPLISGALKTFPDATYAPILPLLGGRLYTDQV
jgi:hypothetical protein